MARDFRDSDLCDTVKSSVDERNIKPNENEITIVIDIHNEIGDLQCVSVKTNGFKMKKGEMLYYRLAFCLCCKN